MSRGAAGKPAALFASNTRLHFSRDLCYNITSGVKGSSRGATCYTLWVYTARPRSDVDDVNAELGLILRMPTRNRRGVGAPRHETNTNSERKETP